VQIGHAIGKSLDSSHTAVAAQATRALATRLDAKVAEIVADLGKTDASLLTFKEKTQGDLGEINSKIDDVVTELKDDTVVKITASEEKITVAEQKIAKLEAVVVGLNADQKHTQLAGLEDTVAEKLAGASASGFSRIASYTTSGTWIKPSGVTRIRVWVTGGGAGGGSHNSDDAQGGGGAGGTAIEIIDVSKLSSLKVEIGEGGDGGSGNCGNCGKPGTSSAISTFSGTVFASAAGGRVPETWGVGGQGGDATKGSLKLKGGWGHSGNIDGYGSSERGGNGGDSYWGGGGGGT
jgi:hypothetical protein